MDIEWRNEATYLRVKIDKKLTWESHIEYARQDARGTRAKLYPMTSRTSKLAFRNKWTLIKSVLQPHLKKLQAHHRNGKDQAERSEDEEAVNYDPELEAPHKRPPYQLLDNG